MSEKTIALRQLEAILYRENGVIDEIDVPLLLEVVYKELGHAVPRRIKDDVERSKKELSW